MVADPVVLVVTGHYLPGFKAGGPIRTIAGIVERLGDAFSFHILTSDRDLGATAPYSDIHPGQWERVGKAHVMYLSPTSRGLRQWQRRLVSTHHHVIYLNGCFSRFTVMTLLLRRLGMIPAKPIILAPRGEFSPGALKLKWFKKCLYLTLSKWSGFYKDIVWHASSAYEQADIERVFGNETTTILVAPDLVSMEMAAPAAVPEKRRHELRAVFLSRIARKKNLDGALHILSSVKERVTFDIYGPIEDAAYWQECLSLVAQLPPNVTAIHKGEIAPEDIGRILSNYHVLLFPTTGENFGHVIVEALRAGCPVLISDQTPWRDLPAKLAGWVVPLSHPEAYRTILSTIAEMDQEAFTAWSNGAREYGQRVAADTEAVEANRRLFHSTIMSATDKGSTS